MNYKHLSLFICLTIACSCHQGKVYLNQIEGKQINISDSLKIDQSVENFIKPYREHVNSNLDSVLAYS